MAVPPFYQSSEQTCGPACLRMLFGALGVSHDEATIGRHCGLTPLGATVQDLIVAAQSLGFHATLRRVSGEPAAVAAPSQQAPFVARIDRGGLPPAGPLFQWHFVVPPGLAQDTVRFHDPADGPDRQAGLDDFLVAWGAAGYRGVRVWTP